MRTMITGILAVLMLMSAAACFWSSDDATSEPSQTPDINATISAAVAKALAEETSRNEASRNESAAPTQMSVLAEETNRNESAAPTQMSVTRVSSAGQTNWLDGLSQFHRIKVARDEVECIGYDSGRYTASSHAIIRIDDGFYALGNPGQAVAFWDDNSGCRIGVITDESLE